LGGYGEHFPANSAMDDFKVYNAELTDDQIELLHIAEYPKGTYVKIRNKNSGKYGTERILYAVPSCPQ
jgi:N-acetyl-beta-hexosaminidase